MRFSTRTRYGLRFLLKLADEKNGRLVQLAQVAREENISLGYLEQIVRALKPLGILRASRGMRGGYALAKDPAEINLEDIFLHLEGEISPVRCLTSKEKCCHENNCSTRLFWQELDNHIRAFLRQKSLQELKEQYDRGQHACEKLH